MPQLHVELREATHEEAGRSGARTTDEKIGHQDARPLHEKTTDDDNLDDIKDSDFESIFDTPRKHKMRKNLRKQKIISVIQKTKTKHLQQKLRRLKKRNVSLEATNGIKCLLVCLKSIIIYLHHKTQACLLLIGHQKKHKKPAKKNTGVFASISAEKP